jgi:iron complex transport system permease protein
MVSQSKRFGLTVLSGTILLIIMLIADLAIGSVDIPFSSIISILAGNNAGNQVLQDIIIDIRLPKALTAILAGAGLSLGGLLTQTLFRNPLAGPDVLGLSSGASLSVAILILTGVGVGTWSVAGAATIGAAGVFLMVMAVSKRIASNSSLLIVGLMIGALTASVIGILQYLSRAEDLQLFTLWTMGNISSASANELWIMLTFSTLGILISFSSIKSLNAWVLGERYSQTLGLNTSSFRWKALISTCLITGSVTAFCGPISFIGIAVPHFVKRIFPSNNHQELIPLTLIVGAILLLLCDMLTLLPSSGIVLPINAATALFGAPVIIWIVIRSKKEFF